MNRMIRIAAAAALALTLGGAFAQAATKESRAIRNKGTAKLRSRSLRVLGGRVEMGAVMRGLVGIVAARLKKTKALPCGGAFGTSLRPAIDQGARATARALGTEPR